uniref:Uncharacterized protein n=1 Tax=Arundo donax TaxID=35708 RepID=A0A0A9G672_ARUDO
MLISRNKTSMFQQVTRTSSSVFLHPRLACGIHGRCPCRRGWGPRGRRGRRWRGCGASSGS